METAECPFCNLPAEEVIWEADLVVAFRDRFPVSEGHTLVISRAHHETYFNANPWEQAEIWRAVNEVKLSLDREFLPSGYNVGFNVKESAGQTVMHLHVHVIPRYEGDVPDPRGGVRGVIPSKQLYKAEPPSSAASIIEDRGSAFRADPFAGLSGFVAGEEAHFAPVLVSCPINNFTYF
jgi:diadenosine tetraphosphate (Ap4A) HIT family hydrolase